MPSSPSHRPLSELALSPLMGALVLPGLFLCVPASGTAQGAEWGVESEIGASLFFGTTDQTLVTTRSAVSRVDSVAEFAGDVRFSYGEATDAGGDSFVSKRSWHASTSFDYRPLARVNAFLFGSVDSSLQKKIDTRWNAGLGAKLGLLRSNSTRVELRVALLGEKTTFEPSVTDGDEDLLARLSARLRLRRSMSDERVTLSSETSYQPNARDFEDFTMVSSNSVAVDVSEKVSLKLSLIDNFDALAEERGASSDNDGQVVFGVLSSFD